MGLCRGLSVLVGACAGPLPFPQVAAPAAIITVLYIAGVTNLARHETRERVPVLARLLPTCAILLAVFAAGNFAMQSPAKEPAVGILLIGAVWVAMLAVRMFRTRSPIPPIIGSHIRVLLLIQAAMCWLGEPWDAGRWAAGALVAFIPLSQLTARRFYAS